MLRRWMIDVSSTPFDLLVTSLWAYLTRIGATPGVAEFTLEQDLPPGVVVYNLSQEELGPVGIIRMRRVGATTELDFESEGGKAGEHFLALLKGWAQQIKFDQRSAKIADDSTVAEIQSGGINIQNSVVTVGGDMVGGMCQWVLDTSSENLV